MFWWYFSHFSTKFCFWNFQLILNRFWQEIVIQSINNFIAIQLFLYIFNVPRRHTKTIYFAKPLVICFVPQPPLGATCTLLRRYSLVADSPDIANKTLTRREKIWQKFGQDECKNVLNSEFQKADPKLYLRLQN